MDETRDEMYDVKHPNIVPHGFQALSRGFKQTHITTTTTSKKIIKVLTLRLPHLWLHLSSKWTLEARLRAAHSHVPQQSWFYDLQASKNPRSSIDVPTLLPTVRTSIPTAARGWASYAHANEARGREPHHPRGIEGPESTLVALSPCPFASMVFDLRLLPPLWSLLCAFLAVFWPTAIEPPDARYPGESARRKCLPAK
jgi:hypothetical protein